MLENRIAFPSGRHCGLVASVDRRVIRCASPPAVKSSTYTCAASSPSRRALNAIRRLSGLQSTPLSPPLVFVRRRGSALPSLGTSQRSLTCSPSVYDGSVTLNTIQRPSGLIAGDPTRFMRKTSSCVIVWRCWAASGEHNKPMTQGNNWSVRITSPNGIGPLMIQGRMLESKQVAQLEEEGIIRAPEPAEAERILVQHVAAVSREHHGSGHRLVAEQRVDVEQIGGARRGARHPAWTGNQNRRVRARVVAQRKIGRASC